MSDGIPADSDMVFPLSKGWNGDGGYFRFIEQIGPEYDFSSVLDVLQGRVVGVIYRGMIVPEICASILDSFRNSPDRVRRDTDAPGDYLGTVHFLRRTSDYLDSAVEATRAFTAVVGPNDPLTLFWNALNNSLGIIGARQRVARHDGRSACPGLIRSLSGSEGYALPPHEDASQCADPQQAGFEIQKVLGFEIAAINICIESAVDGKLAVWNLKPSEAFKRWLGISYSGFPYPLHALDGIGRLDITINVGDVYVFNAGHVHAVDPITVPGSRRTTIAALFGFISSDTVVSWA